MLSTKKELKKKNVFKSTFHMIFYFTKVNVIEKDLYLV